MKGNGLLIRPKISQVFSLSELRIASFSLFTSIINENGVRKGEKVMNPYISRFQPQELFLKSNSGHLSNTSVLWRLSVGVRKKKSLNQKFYWQSKSINGNTFGCRIFLALVGEEIGGCRRMRPERMCGLSWHACSWLSIPWRRVKTGSHSLKKKTIWDYSFRFYLGII